MAAKADFEEIRSLDYSSISGSYTAVGGAFSGTVRGICFTNDTEGSVMFTNDVTKDKIFVKAGSFKLLDIQSNINPRDDDAFVLAAQETWYVKSLEGLVSGSVYIEVLTNA